MPAKIPVTVNEEVPRPGSHSQLVYKGAISSGGKVRPNVSVYRDPAGTNLDLYVEVEWQGKLSSFQVVGVAAVWEVAKLHVLRNL